MDKNDYFNIAYATGGAILVSSILYSVYAKNKGIKYKPGAIYYTGLALLTVGSFHGIYQLTKTGNTRNALPHIVGLALIGYVYGDKVLNYAKIKKVI